jgi:hypothetical protein
MNTLTNIIHHFSSQDNKVIEYIMINNNIEYELGVNCDHDSIKNKIYYHINNVTILRASSSDKFERIDYEYLLDNNIIHSFEKEAFSKTKYNRRSKSLQIEKLFYIFGECVTHDEWLNHKLKKKYDRLKKLKSILS